MVKNRNMKCGGRLSSHKNTILLPPPKKDNSVLILFEYGKLFCSCYYSHYGNNSLVIFTYYMKIERSFHNVVHTIKWKIEKINNIATNFLILYKYILIINIKDQSLCIKMLNRVIQLLLVKTI